MYKNHKAIIKMSKDSVTRVIIIKQMGEYLVNQ